MGAKRLVLEDAERDVFDAVVALYACWRLHNQGTSTEPKRDLLAAKHVTRLTKTKEGEELLIEALARLSLMDES